MRSVIGGTPVPCPPRQSDRGKYAKTMRLTADLALVHDETYAAIVAVAVEDG